MASGTLALLDRPLLYWWYGLTLISVGNIAVWLVLMYRTHQRQRRSSTKTWEAYIMVSLAGVFVLVCAYRAILPRADVQRFVLFNTWLSSVFLGRSLATIAELCFALQWVLALYFLAQYTRSRIVKGTTYTILPLILLAECFSWYAVITTNYLGNVIEESIWTMTFLLIAGNLYLLRSSFRGVMNRLLTVTTVGLLCYVLFMITVDVPMYVFRWQESQGGGYALLQGLNDLRTHWIPIYKFSVWKDELAWMTFYFSVAVWCSLALSWAALHRYKISEYVLFEEHREH